MGARCAWEVTAGVIPRRPMPEHTKRWGITSETWEAENAMSDDEFKEKHPDGKSSYAKAREEAYAYAASLNDPRYLNWVRIDWIWF